MRKILFIIIAILSVALIIFLFLIFSLMGRQTTKQTTLPNPTPIEFTGSNTGPYQIVSLNPKNQSVNVPLSSTMSLIFNKSLEGLSPTVNISPTTPFTSAISGNTIIITPSTPLIPSTQYTVTLQLEKQSFFLSFVSLGPTPTSNPSTRDLPLIDKDTLEMRTNYPDAYLANFTPFSNGNFSVTSDFVPTKPTGHFNFIITPKATIDQAKTAFNSWAKEKGLTDDQISKLDVVYK